jgi:hypothetical protein
MRPVACGPPYLALVACFIWETKASSPSPSLIKTCPFLQNCENALILANFGSVLSKTYFLACACICAVDRLRVGWLSSIYMYYVQIRYCYISEQVRLIKLKVVKRSTQHHVHVANMWTPHPGAMLWDGWGCANEVYIWRTETTVIRGGNKLIKSKFSKHNATLHFLCSGTENMRFTNFHKMPTITVCMELSTLHVHHLHNNTKKIWWI